MTYPVEGQFFCGEKEGFGYVFEGHGLPDGVIRSVLSYPGGWEYAEVWMQHKRRVKYCGRYGKACFEEGHWHEHWFACKPDHGQPYTMVWPDYSKEYGWKRKIA